MDIRQSVTGTVVVVGVPFNDRRRSKIIVENEQLFLDRVGHPPNIWPGYWNQLDTTVIE